MHDCLFIYTGFFPLLIGITNSGLFGLRGMKLSVMGSSGIPRKFRTIFGRDCLSMAEFVEKDV
jgi:hypothetical protein